MKHKNEFATIINLAKQARCHVEILALANNKKTLQVGLCGYCAVASIHLCKLAKYLNINLNFVCGEYSSDHCKSGHCWVEYKDKIIDVTATQFRKDQIKSPVFITDIGNKNYIKKGTNKGALVRIRYWPKEQSYVTYEKQLRGITLIVGQKILSNGQVRISK